MLTEQEYTRQRELFAKAKADLLAIARGTNPYGIAEYIGERDYAAPDSVDSPEPGKSYHPAVANAEYQLRARIGRDESGLSDDIKKQRARTMELYCDTIALYMALMRPERIAK